VADRNYGGLGRGITGRIFDGLLPT